MYKIGFWTVLALVMGNTIGAGVFMLPTALAAYGSLSLLGWGITLMGALSLAAIFVRLMLRFPTRSGGPYVYVHKALGNFWGFQTVWIYWISMWVGSTATVTATVGYLSVFIPELSKAPLHAFLAGSALIWGFTFLNLVSLRTVGFVQILTTICKIAPFLVVVLLGLPHLEMKNLAPFNPQEPAILSPIFGATLLTMWAFIGIESATIPLGSIQNPKKTIPRATFWGTALIGLFYIILAFFMITLIPNELLKKSEAPFALAGQYLLGPWGKPLFAGIAVLASIGSLNGWFLIQSQVPAFAARDRLFMPIFARHNKENIPVFSLILTAGLMNIFLLFNFMNGLIAGFNTLIVLATVAVLVTYLLSVVSEAVFLFKESKSFARKQISAIALVLLSLAYVSCAIIGAEIKELMYSGLFFLSGVPIYFVGKKANFLLVSK